MWDKRLFLMTAGDSGTGESFYEDQGTRSLCLSTDSNCRLDSLLVYGTHDSLEADGRKGLGYEVDGSFFLDVRIHGENFLDGYELERLMLRSGSPTYGGRRDDEYFIYRTVRENCEVVSRDHLSLPDLPFTLRMSALVDEELATDGIFSPGLYFYSDAGGHSNVFAESAPEGEVELSGSTPGWLRFDGFRHDGAARELEIPIRYDSVSLTVGGAPTDEPYIGRSASFPIGKRMLATADDGVRDELECVRGVLTKRVGSAVIDSSFSIVSAVYGGKRCFMITLPKQAGYGLISIGSYTECDLNDFAYYSECIAATPDRKSVYIRFDDDIELSEARERLEGLELIYPLRYEEIYELGEGLGRKMAVGANYIDVCTPLNAEIEIFYYTEEQ